MSARGAILLVSVALLTLTCRSPQPEETYDPDAGDFVPSLIDDQVGSLCPADSPRLFNNAYSPYKGGTESIELVVVDFSELECPACASFSKKMRDLYDQRPDIKASVRTYYHHVPFAVERAWQKHGAAHGAANQDIAAFWRMHDYMYDSILDGVDPWDLTVEMLEDFAKFELGLDMDTWNADRASESTYSFLAWDKGQAEAANGGASVGVPSVYICGEKISWGALETEIDMYLNPQKD